MQIYTYTNLYTWYTQACIHSASLRRTECWNPPKNKKPSTGKKPNKVKTPKKPQKPSTRKKTNKVKTPQKPQKVENATLRKSDKGVRVSECTLHLMN